MIYNNILPYMCQIIIWARYGNCYKVGNIIILLQPCTYGWQTLWSCRKCITTLNLLFTSLHLILVCRQLLCLPFLNIIFIYILSCLLTLMVQVYNIIGRPHVPCLVQLAFCTTMAVVAKMSRASLSLFIHTMHWCTITSSISNIFQYYFDMFIYYPSVLDTFGSHLCFIFLYSKKMLPFVGSEWWKCANKQPNSSLLYYWVGHVSIQVCDENPICYDFEHFHLPCGPFYVWKIKFRF